MHTLSTIPAIVLAAGLSSRMGAFKPLLSLGGKPLIGRVIDSLRGSGCVERIIVVSGHRRSELEEAVPVGVEVAFNSDFAAGEMISSVKTGLRKMAEVSPLAGGFLLAFADQPAVLSATIRALVEGFGQGMPPLVFPVHGGRKGHPLVLSAELIEEIAGLSSGETLRVVTARHMADAQLVAVDDPAVLEDLDTPEDYARAEVRLRGSGGRNPEGHY